MTGKINKLWLAVTLLLLAAACGLFSFAASGEPLYFRAAGDPEQTVQAFFEALLAEDYPAACAYLNGYASLGLEAEAETEEGRALFAALKQSYGWSTAGALAVNGKTAAQPVKFRCLDVARMEKEVAARLGEVLEELAGEREPEALYDAEGRWLPEVAGEAYTEAFFRTLGDAGQYEAETVLMMELDYVNQSWRIRVTPELLTALRGGIS